MKKIRMGVIGLGSISRNHIEGIRRSPDAELIAVCDLKSDVLKTKGEALGISEDHRFGSYSDLLMCEDVDAVSICTQNDAHLEITLNAIKQKKPFILEKPVTLNYNQALTLKKLANENNIKNMIAFSYRYKPAVRFARWIIKQGHLGRIYHINVSYLQGWGISDQMPLVWRFKKDKSGSGALGDLGSHMIDLTRFLVGDFEEVCSQAGTFIKERKNIITGENEDVDVDDYCNFMALLERDVAAVFAITRNAYGRGNYQRIEVYGSKGGLVYNLDNEDSIQVCIGDVYNSSKEYKQIRVPDEYKADQMQSFFDIINGKADGLSADIDDGYRNQYILDKIIESFDKKSWVSLRENV